MKFEFKRIFKDKKVVLFIAFILSLSLFYASSGIKGYKSFLSKKESFFQYEKQKVNQYINYAQYGGHGFRVLYEISPLKIFFFNSTVFQNIEGNIDTLETLKIYHSFKGKNLFSYSGNFKDFSGSIFLFGSIFMLYMGAAVLKSKNYFKSLFTQFGFNRAILSPFILRFLLLNLFFILLSGTVFLFLIIREIPLNINVIYSFTFFLIYSLLFLNSFYFAGFLLKIIFNFKPIAYLGLIILWIVSIFLIPEINRSNLSIKSQQLPSNEKFNIKKLKTLMDFERRARVIAKKEIDKKMEIAIKKGKKYNYGWQVEIQKKLAAEFQRNEFLLNINREMVLKKKMKEIIEKYESISLLHPSLYYSVVSREISGQGYYGYLDFFEYVIKMRTNFMSFYIKNRYNYVKKKVESFIKKDENIFKARSHVPKTFWYGVGITLCYCIVMFIASYLLLKRRIYQS